ncbi:MAG: type II toxin-antitoxin system VapC family toxin [Acidobacteria bacterium]|nr:type II toxin-antitoxin system VapC family toxin [Acidobacteriota bacterium]
MIAYIDTSALLRTVLREPGAIEGLRSYEALVSNELIVVECARTIDRLRIQGSLTPHEAAERVRAVNEWLEAIDLVLLRPVVLSRASEPMPMAVGTLDAIHLATALIWRDRVGPLPQMATHDTALAAAARTFGFEVLGT